MQGAGCRVIGTRVPPGASHTLPPPLRSAYEAHHAATIPATWRTQVFGNEGLEMKVQGLGFRDQDLRMRVQGLRLKDSGSRTRV